MTKAKMIKLTQKVQRKILKYGVTKPIVQGVVLHGEKIRNKPAYFERFALFGYVVVLHHRRVITAYFDRGRV